MRLDPIVEKYLALYGEPEARWAQRIDLADRSWDAVVAVPAAYESHHLADMLASLAATDLAQAGRMLAVLTLNLRSDANPTEEAAHAVMTRQLAKITPDRVPLGASPPAWLGRIGTLDLLVIERVEGAHRFGPKDGVGLARKIGCDVALALVARGLVTSPWLHNTDADARLPVDFGALERTLAAEGNEAGQVSVVLNEHEHVFDDREVTADGSDVWRALMRYEIWLRYYVLGLRHASSPYAFHTIGSLIAVSAEAYARTRGFPKRQAGEDFYFLNKLAKVGRVVTRHGRPTLLMSRSSARVPFGTGQGTEKIRALESDGGSYTIYDPKIFTVLGAVLRASEHYLAHRSEERFWDELQSETNAILERDGFLALQEQLGAICLLTACDGALKRSRDHDGALRQFHEWFDAFRTLKLVHWLRDHLFPNQPMTDALAHASFLPRWVTEQSPSLDELLKAVREHERSLAR